MSRKLTFAVLSLAAAAAALPASANVGKDQFAATLGVNPDLYTMSELIRLDDALGENDLTTARAILDGDIRPNGSDVPVVNAATVQLAASLGVDPADHTPAELARMHTDRFD